LAFILGAIRPFELPLTLEHALGELAHIKGAICLGLLSKAMRQVLLEVSRIDRTIGVFQRPLAFFGAFSPLAIIDCAVSPLAQALPSHLSFDPLSLIFPALHSTHEEALPLLEPIHIFSLV